jgi:hypothetical protein
LHGHSVRGWKCRSPNRRRSAIICGTSVPAKRNCAQLFGAWNTIPTMKIVALIEAAKAVVDADGIRRPREVQFLEQLSCDLAEL